jgi:uncharacterized phage-associated protein
MLGDPGEISMTYAIDVARYIVEKCGEMTAMKLQKLLYYSQAWHMVWEEKELFPDEFKAWANGPVTTSVYGQHRGRFLVDATTFPTGNVNALTPQQRGAVDRVLDFYGKQTAQWLSNLTHQEAPWVEARAGLEPGAPSDKVIEKAAIHEYYSSLRPS